MFDRETTLPRCRSVRLFTRTLFERCFTQIYRALYEDAMLVPIQMGSDTLKLILLLEQEPFSQQNLNNNSSFGLLDSLIELPF